MDTLIAIKGQNFVLMASDSSVSRSIVKLKGAEDKFYKVGNVSFAYNGLQSDGYRICNFVTEKLTYEKIENNLNITPNTVASVIQKMIHESLRRNPKDSSIIVCSHNEVFYIDKYGAKFSDNFICGGLGASFLYGVIDKHYKNGMSYEECLSLLKTCLSVLKKRFLVNADTFYVRIIKETEFHNMVINA